jgi:hypothetical protein
VALSLGVVARRCRGWRVLKRGGVLAFDGWTVFSEVHRRPGPAIDAFLICYAGKLHLLHKGYQVLVKKLW